MWPELLYSLYSSCCLSLTAVSSATDSQDAVRPVGGAEPCQPAQAFELDGSTTSCAPEGWCPEAPIVLTLRPTLQDVATLPELAGAIGSSLEESGAVRESASEGVKKARGKVRTIEGRIRGILKASCLERILPRRQRRQESACLAALCLMCHGMQCTLECSVLPQLSSAHGLGAVAARPGSRIPPFNLRSTLLAWCYPLQRVLPVVPSGLLSPCAAVCWPGALPSPDKGCRLSCLQGYQGEVTEQGGRMCVALPASADGPPKGILLGSGPGGTSW
jgi:hypothetical protein